jgi:hypothetical protein
VPGRKTPKQPKADQNPADVDPYGLAQNSVCKWANTLLGNVKNALSGTVHAFDLKHSPRYLTEFEYRFKRRCGLGAKIVRFSYAEDPANAIPAPQAG